jgi:hypothetical protein
MDIQCQIIFVFYDVDSKFNIQQRFSEKWLSVHSKFKTSAKKKKNAHPWIYLLWFDENDVIWYIEFFLLFSGSYV